MLPGLDETHHLAHVAIEVAEIIVSNLNSALYVRRFLLIVLSFHDLYYTTFRLCQEFRPHDSFARRCFWYHSPKCCCKTPSVCCVRQGAWWP